MASAHQRFTDPIVFQEITTEQLLMSKGEFFDGFRAGWHLSDFDKERSNLWKFGWSSGLEAWVKENGKEAKEAKEKAKAKKEETKNQV